jgi:hypothetical protein
LLHVGFELTYVAYRFLQKKKGQAWYCLHSECSCGDVEEEEEPPTSSPTTMSGAIKVGTTMVMIMAFVSSIAIFQV